MEDCGVGDAGTDDRVVGDTGVEDSIMGLPRWHGPHGDARTFIVEEEEGARATDGGA